MIWYQLNKTQIENELETDAEAGLTAAEAGRRFSVLGPNRLPEPKPESVAGIFLRQFRNPLIYVLLVCAAIIYYLGEISDAFIILVVLVFNAAVGAVQEGRSQRALQSLKKLSFAESDVVRDGEEVVVPEHEIVPGDVVIFQEGQKVTADARVVYSSNLTVDESALTGESGGVVKRDQPLTASGLTPAGQTNMVFKGTNVLAGNGKAIVVGTALNTEIGKISRALMQPEVEIPLQRNIRKLSEVIIVAIVGISAALFGLGILAGMGAREMFTVVVSLAVSIIPEGLPLVLTLILVTGVWRMSRRHALVKKLQAVEALGQANILAVDKTGTITKNEMVIKHLYTSGCVYQITGNGYEPKGEVRFDGKLKPADAAVEWSATLAGLLSKAAVVYSEKEQKYKVSGDPTEAAMTVFAEKFGFPREKLIERYPEIGEIPFDSKTKYHAVFHDYSREVLCAVAGAPEAVLKLSETILENGQHRPLSAHERRRIEDTQAEFSERGLRVVAFGYKKLPKSHKLDQANGLIFAGLFAIEDQVRPEVVSAVRLAQRAGLKVVMITGDNKITARAIAREAGIYREGDEVLGEEEFRGLTDEQLAGKLDKVSVFSRITPEGKMRIVAAYRKAGLIVAMMGDGVNDAPPLVAADLGVAMGGIGTEVAKEAADIVLLDDNLATIVVAIEEGRAMHRNIQKALLFLFSTSLGELLTITLALFLGMPLPILAVQILWLNLITDPLIGMAMAMDGKEPGLLERPMERLPKYFITKTMLLQMAIIGLVMAIGTLYLFSLYEPLDYTKAVTVSLTLLAVFQWYNGFNCRSESRSVFSRELLANRYLWLAIVVNLGMQLLAVYNPYFQRVLRTSPLTLREWLIILGLGFTIILAEEARKLLVRIRTRRTMPRG